MPFFPSRRDNNQGWHFDIVGLLAVIGESSMSLHAQPLTSSWLCCLPRLIPAPQALLKSSRPYRLPTAKGVVVMGIYGGTLVDELNYFADIIHQVEDVARYEFKAVRLRYSTEPERQAKSKRRRPARSSTLSTVEEKDEDEGKSRLPDHRLRLPLHNKEIDGQVQPRSSSPRTSVPRAPGQISEDTTRQSVGSRDRVQDEPLQAGHQPPNGSYQQPGDPKQPDLPPEAEPRAGSKRHSIELERHQDGGDFHPTESSAAAAIEPNVQLRKRRTDLSTQSTTSKLSFLRRPEPEPEPPTQPGDSSITEVPQIPARTISPLNILTVFSVLLNVGMVIWAGLIRDGIAVVALCTMAFASSIIGFASLWKPNLAQRPTSAPVPYGDIVIKTRAGAFIVVECSEEIARELYHGTERCKYVLGDQAHRVLVGIGTLLLMVAVVLLGNCEWTMQAAIGAAYILLNGLYWGAALLPRSWHWDMSRYHWEDVTPTRLQHADKGNFSFTRTMWYAIQYTQQADWVQDGAMAPRTGYWSEWCDDALKEARMENWDWNAVGRKNELMADARNILRQQKQNKMGTEGLAAKEGRSASIVPDEGVTTGIAGSPSPSDNHGRLIIRGAGDGIVG
ncbi:MAG: hypothetical protein Q9227_006734 [Pyrenula ochraceoflavens]